LVILSGPENFLGKKIKKILPGHGVSEKIFQALFGCPARDLRMVVVQGMKLIGGRNLLSADGPGFPD
jgi:hypothetical protein